MSQENADTVRRFFAAVRAYRYHDAGAELHPDAEWHNTSAFPGPRTVRGAREIAGFLEDMFRSYGGAGDSGGMEIEDMTHGDDVVVTQHRGWWSSATGGVPLEMRWAQIARLRDGKIVRVDIYGDYGKALEAAKLTA